MENFNFLNSADQKKQLTELTVLVEEIKRQLFLLDQISDFFEVEASLIENKHQQAKYVGKPFYLRLSKMMAINSITANEPIDKTTFYQKISQRTMEYCENKLYEINLNECDGYLDKLSQKYKEKGLAELVRIYTFGYYPDDEGYTSSFPLWVKEDNQIIARGITAFLAYENKETAISYRESIGVLPIYLHNIYKEYFDHCITFSDLNQRRIILFEEDLKSQAELNRLHYQSEKEILEAPQLFYEEIPERTEGQIIRTINEAAKRYIKWIKDNYLDNLTFETNLDQKRLEEIRNHLTAKNLINGIKSDDFVYLFSGKPITSDMVTLLWIGSKQLCHEFLKRAVYKTNQFNFPQFNKCIIHSDGKPFDSNSKSNAKFLGNSTFDPIGLLEIKEKQ